MRAARLLLITAIVLLTAASVASGRSVPRGFLGVVADGRLLDGSVPIASQVARMRNDGVETVGATFDWAQAQPYPSMDGVPPADRARFQDVGGVPTDFQNADRVVAAAASARLAVFPTVLQAPSWGALNPGRPWSPPLVAPFAAYVGALARRYGPGGSFWAQHPQLKPMPIRAWQLWNEPVGGRAGYTSNYWDDTTPFQARYTDMLHATRDAVKSFDPAAKIVVAGLVGFSWKTMQMLYDAGARPYFDAVALHPYTADPGNVIKIIRFNRQVLNANRDAAKPIYISEVGYPANDVTRLRQGAKRLAKVQATWLSVAFTALIKAHAKLNIAQILWYTWMGDDVSQANPFDYAGLLHHAPSGRITGKPALGAFFSIAHRVER